MGISHDCLYPAIEVIQARHTETRAKDTLRKLERGEPLRIWALCSIRTTVLQYVMQDLIAGFRELGHECTLLVEGDPREYVGNLIAVSVAESHPDVLVMADHLRAEVPRVLPPTLPCLTLILDEVPNLSAPATIARLGDYDLTFPWSHGLCRLYEDLGYPHTHCLPFAASPARFAVPDEDLPLKDVVAFATHLDVPVDFEFSPGFSDFLIDRYKSLPEVPRGRDWVRCVVDLAIEEFGVNVPESRREEFYYQALLMTRVADRTQIADAVIDAGLPLALYGRGWREREKYAAYAKGIVTPGAALRDMYHTHKVVLHVNQNCNMHPRVLEAMCAKGFVLARSDKHHSDEHNVDWVGQHLDTERELCLFTSLDDMVTKIRRALTDESWRQAFVRAGHARVTRDHTYVQRTKVMLAELRCKLRCGGSDTRRVA
ncbi:MAG: glycosyltransferase [Myxococcales bacterium FL481]|nr:MAG: glycosyltransferase [Myxococcales bacterium FL481]